MAKCEKYNVGIAFDVNNRVYCGIKRGTCPYHCEGHRIQHKDNIYIVCKTGGLVGKLDETDKNSREEPTKQ